MKSSKLYIVFLSIFVPAFVYAQTTAPSNPLDNNQSDSAFRFVKWIPGNYIYLNVDMLDNIYLITAGNQLKKINGNGDSLAVFNDVKKYGNPSYIDVTNPLKILVYYKNYSTVVVLDRLLTERNTINLRNHHIFSVQAVATSYDNNIWLFDEQDYKLKKINEEGEMLQESSDLRQLMDSVPSPQVIIDNENQVFLYDTSRGFYIFDYYGAMKNTIPFLKWNDVAVSGKQMMGFSEKKLFSYQLNSLNLKTYRLPHFFKDYDAIKAINGKLYLLKKDGVEIYSVQ